MPQEITMEEMQQYFSKELETHAQRSSKELAEQHRRLESSITESFKGQINDLKLEISALKAENLVI